MGRAEKRLVKKEEQQKKRKKKQQEASRKNEESESSDSSDGENDRNMGEFGHQSIDGAPTSKKKKKKKRKKNLATIKTPQMADIKEEKKDEEKNKMEESTKLSRSKLRKIFNKADTKRRGQIDKKQFIKILARFGHELGRLWKPEEISSIFSEMMDPISKLMSFDAFLGAFVRHAHNEKVLAKKLIETRKKTEFGSRQPERSLTGNQIHLKDTNSSTDINHMDKWVATIVALCYLLYPTLCNATFALVGCRYIGKYYAYIQMDMQIKCYDDRHYVIIGSIFAPALIAYVIGIPVMFFVLLRKNINTLSTNKHTKFRYSTLLIGYRPECYYWEVVISSRKAAIVAISVFLLQFGPRVQTLVAQALTAMLLILHTHFEPFVPVTKHRNPLHHGDFFALVTAFLTLTAGIYLFQNVGESQGFQIFLTVIVITTNVVYVGVTLYWYVSLRLVDMENQLIDADKNQAFTAWLVMHLQKFLPDWRARASAEEIIETNNIERNIIHNVDVQHVLKIKSIAQKWRMKSQRHAFEREARELEDSYKGDQLKLVQKLERLRRQSAIQIQQRITKRKSDKLKRESATKIAAAKSGQPIQVVLGKAATTKQAIATLATHKQSLPFLELVKGMKLTTLGFQLKPDHKKKCAVRSIDTTSKAYENGIRDGFVLRWIGDFSTDDENIKSIVRLLQTQPRPLMLRFEHLEGGVAAIKEEGMQKSDDSDII